MEILRPPIAGGEAARLRPDPLPVFAVVAKALASNAGGFERALQAEIEQFAHRVRQHVDADSEGLQLRNGLDDPDADPVLVQAQGRREPTDARPHDHHVRVHASSLLRGRE